MIIKNSDERAGDVKALNALLRRPSLSGAQRAAIEKTLRALRSGIKGEREAAYHINFYCGDNDNFAVIHDLRIEHEGQIAQIDHLIIGRLLTGFVCETKYWSSAISINAQGEFTAHYGRKNIGVPSPIAQNARHIKVIEKMLSAGRTQRPKRLGVKIPFALTPLTLVSTGTEISRPEGKAGEAFSQVIKADQFYDYVQQHVERHNSALHLGKLVSAETLRGVAQSIADLHQPIVMNYAAKFGVQPETPAMKTAKAKMQPPKPKLKPNPKPRAVQISQMPTPKKYRCATCGEGVELNVARFCWYNKPRFNNEIRCRSHQ